VHQGDGSAAILSSHPDIFTFSMHCARNFPHRKQTSDLDLALADGLGDDAYLDALKNHLPWLLDRFAPELVIYDAGVDVHVDDRLGHLSLTDTGLARRDHLVIEACRSRSIATACVIGGGYDRDVAALAARHAILHQQAAKIYPCETVRIF
jgi:acetoin utilization deacetylase AcuC-like enzyme